MAPFGKIYSFMPNTRVLKILAAANLNNLEIEIAQGFEMGITNRSPEFLAKFPAGKVPAFEGSDGLCLPESDAIAQYVAQSGPRSAQLLGRDAVTAARIRQWICFNEGEVMLTVLSLVLWRVGMGPFDETKETEGLARIDKALGVVEKHLEGGREWLVGEELTLADLTLASGFLWAYRHIIDEAMRQRFPMAVAWYLRTIGHEEVKDVFGEPVLIGVRRQRPE